MPDPESLHAAVDAADRWEETCELGHYAAAERALTARRQARHALGKEWGMDGEPIGPRAQHAPLVLRRLGATLVAAAAAKREFEVARMNANARHRALRAGPETPDD